MKRALHFLRQLIREVDRIDTFDGAATLGYDLTLAVLPAVLLAVLTSLAPPAAAQGGSSALEAAGRLLGVPPAPSAPAPGARPTPRPALAASEAASAAPAETVGVAREDERLMRELLARYARMPDLQAVQVQVNAGVATLAGEVPTEEVRGRAVTLAREIGGVVEVDNRLRLDTSLSVRLRPALQRVIDAVVRLVGLIPLLVLAALLIAAMTRLGRWLGERAVLHRLVREQPFLEALLRQSLRFAMAMIGLVIALDLLDATALVSAVIGTAGLVGLALGFALRDVVENYIAGLLLSLRQPFAMADHVVIDGHEGRVASLTTRATTLITLDGNHLRLPNSLVFKGVILNYTRNPLRRLVFAVGVGVSEDLVRTQRIGIETLRSMRGIRHEPPPLALVMQLAESSVTVEYSAWFDQRESSYFRLRSEAIRLVKAALDAGGVDLPEPTYRVQLTQPGTEADAPADAVQRAAAPPAELPDDDVTVERGIEAQLAEEQVRSAANNLLKPHAARE